MCEKPSSGRPSARTAAAESPPPTTLNAPLPVAPMIASATPLVPAANAGNSNTPIGPFQKIVCAFDRSAVNLLTDLRSDVQTHFAVGYPVGDHGLRRRVGLELVGHHDVHRQVDHVAVGFQNFPAGVDHLRLHERCAHRKPACGKEGETHPATDDQAVGFLRQLFDHRQLVGHLGSAQHDRVRPLGGTGQLLQHFDFRLDQLARVVWQQRRDVVHRGLLAVHDTEPVGHERAVRCYQFGQLPCQRQSFGVVLAGFPRVEPDVLQQQDVTVGQALGSGQRVGPDDVAGQLHMPAELFAERGGDGA